MKKIPFSKPYLTGEEIDFIKDTLSTLKLKGDGKYTYNCQELMQKKFNAKKILLTTSCTHALEMSAILLNIKKGDEIILPSFTFSSTCNAFVLRGAKPVFVDIREDTLNMDERLIEDKITDKTKAIAPVHYAGVGCEMDVIRSLSKKYNLPIVEDAAQGVNAKYKGQYLGTIGDIGAYSFHETKNYVAGEGGAVLINDQSFTERAEIIREKGTNRINFLRGEVDKYTWVDVGSSYLPSDILAALLYSQLKHMDEFTEERKRIYNYYGLHLTTLEEKEKLKLPKIPKGCESNYHCFHILLNSENERNKVMQNLKSTGIQAAPHYVPLHDSLMGHSFGYSLGDLPITESASSRLLRLPLYNGMENKDLDYVLMEFFKSLGETYHAN